MLPTKPWMMGLPTGSSHHFAWMQTTSSPSLSCLITPSMPPSPDLPVTVPCPSVGHRSGRDQHQPGHRPTHLGASPPQAVGGAKPQAACCSVHAETRCDSVTNSYPCSDSLGMSPSMARTV